MSTIDQFALDMRAFPAKARSNAGAIIRKTTIDVGTHVVLKSPVGNPSLWDKPESAPPGYVGGRFRANWQYGYGQAPSTQLSLIDTSREGRDTAGRLAADVLTASDDPFGIHYIVNNLPYARRLEYEGWSTQAPNGMVGVSMIKFREFIAKNIEEAT